MMLGICRFLPVFSFSGELFFLLTSMRLYEIGNLVTSVLLFSEDEMDLNVHR